MQTGSHGCIFDLIRVGHDHVAAHENCRIIHNLALSDNTPIVELGIIEAGAQRCP